MADLGPHLTIPYTTHQSILESAENGPSQFVYPEKKTPPGGGHGRRRAGAGNLFRARAR